jgi:2-C-methyl-D-erythritol 2,4-cyclodiphosphate synthase
MIVKVGHGQDSHRFSLNDQKPLFLGGLKIPGSQGLDGNSDADVILHAITDAISSITGVTVIGQIADRMCQEGVTDSKVYLAKSLEYLVDYKITHVSVVLECKRPRIDIIVPKLKESIADLLSIDEVDVGITATSGEGLSEFGRGEGIYSTAIITVVKI